jgi:uncharacterized protein YecT (DUF1311 family)
MQARIALSFAVVGLVIATAGPACAQTQAEMTEQACGELKKAEAELNRVYQEVLAANGKDTAFVEALREAQRAWIAFRDAHVRSIFPDPGPMAYGSVNPMCRCLIHQQLTLQRTKQLRELWIEGRVEGDVCAGSSLIKR